MNQDPVRVSQIHWLRVFPFLRLGEAIRQGTGLAVLLLAMLAVVVSWAGSGLINRAFQKSDVSAVAEFPWRELSKNELGPVAYSSGETTLVGSALPAPVASLYRSATRVLFQGYDGLPLLNRHRRQRASWWLSLELLLWNALVLGLFGVAIGRMVGTVFCRQVRTGPITASRYGLTQYRSVLLSTGLVLFFPGALRVLLWAADTVAGWGSAGAFVVSLAWGLVLLLSLLLLLVFVVCLAAWFLSLAAIAVDGCRGAEALSRCFSYVLSHRLWAIGGMTAVAGLCLLTRWGLQALTAMALHAVPQYVSEQSADRLRAVWTLAFELIPHAAQLSVFFAGTTILYVLLRQREDEIPLPEIDGAV